LQETKRQQDTTQEKLLLGAANTHTPPVPGRRRPGKCCSGGVAPRRSSLSMLPIDLVVKELDKQPSETVWGNDWCSGKWRLFRAE